MATQLNLFAYGSDNESSGDDKEAKHVDHELSLQGVSFSKDSIIEDGNHSEMKECVPKQAASQDTQEEDDKMCQSTEKQNDEQSGKSVDNHGDNKNMSIKRLLPQSSKPKVDLSSYWVSVLDPNSNQYYYWNRMTNETTWTRPASYSEKPKTPTPRSTTDSNTIVSSGQTFQRCKKCKGWGKDIIQSDGFCGHCRRITSSSVLPQVSSTAGIHSKAADILMMQPELRFTKKRPECNIPLSLRSVEESWKKRSIDPLDLGKDSHLPGERTNKRRKSSIC